MATRTAFMIAVMAVVAVAAAAAAAGAVGPQDASLVRTARHAAVSAVQGPPLVIRPALHRHLLAHGHTVEPVKVVPRDPVTGSTPVVDLPVNGSVWPVGGFETTVWVGTPPQIQLVQIDTGSSDLLVAQEGCTACPSPKYNPASSSTVKPVDCTSDQFHCKGCSGPDKLCFYNNTYQTCDYAAPAASCSLLGTTFYDVVSLGPGSPVKTVVGFGGIQEHQGAFDNEWTNMPGVMGMGYPALANVWSDNTTFNAWVSAGLLKAVFGMCLTGDVGHMTLGGINSKYYTGELQWTPIILQQWYTLRMLDLAVGGVSIGLPSEVYNRIANGTILDSGTNTFVVGTDVLDVIAANMVSMCGTVNLHGICDVEADKTLFTGSCYTMTAAQIAMFPPVSVTLQGTGQLAVPPQDYLIPHPELQGAYCMGIQSSGVGGFTILGNVFQSAFYVVFDQETTQLGFAPVQNCN